VIVKNNILFLFVIVTLIGCGRSNDDNYRVSEYSEYSIMKNMESKRARRENYKRKLDQERESLRKQSEIKLSSTSVMSSETTSYGEAFVSQDKFISLQRNGIKQTTTSPVSIFSIDVDTAAFSYIRQSIVNGEMPSSDVVRIEEMINYFDYDYSVADDNSEFSVTTEIATSPWNKDSLLLQIGLKGQEPALNTRPDANLIFLIDVSGSMEGDDRLGLIKKGLHQMVKQLTAQDRVSVIVYAGQTTLLLDGVPGDKKAQISSVINKLVAEGSTNGGSGIYLAYKAARQNLIKNGINRVIIATDGDFNIGTVDHQTLIDMVKREAKSGVQLSVLGVGKGNFNDATMEQLADQGNGNYAYLDTVKEAHRVLGRNMLSTLLTVARDVKIQVEFNPSQVAEYRLIGYENRELAQEDFNNDKADAGELGAGHTVTALYEITLNDSKGKRIGPLRYQTKVKTDVKEDELAYVKVRYKPADKNKSILKSYAVKKTEIKNLNKATHNLKFAAAVASFGQLLRQSKYSQSISYDDVINLVKQSKGNDEHGERAEFLAIVEMAEKIELH